MNQALAQNLAMQEVKSINFIDSSISMYPFQLLPNAVYPAEVLERALAWQADFGRMALAEVEIAVVYLNLPDSEAKARFDESLAVQSIAANECYAVDAKAKSFAGELQQILVSIKSEYLLLTSSTTMLNPQSLFALKKQTLLEPASFYLINSVLLSENLKATLKYIRRAVPSVIDFYGSAVVGQPVLVKKELLTKFFSNQTSVSTSLVGFCWELCAFAVESKEKVSHLPFSLATHSESAEVALWPSANECEAIVKIIFPVPYESIECTQSGILNTPRIDIKPLLPLGSIQIIIPFKDQLEVTSRCLQSLFTIDISQQTKITLVNNNSTPETIAQLTEVCKEAPCEVSLVDDDQYFNYARLNNQAAKAENTDFILLLNNDVEFSDYDCLSELKRWMAIDDVGIVGGMLSYPEGGVQHGGISFVDARPLNVVTPWDKADILRETDAVSFAMALIRREVFEALGGLDEFICPNGFGDAVFCKRARDLGWRTVYTPFARAIHHESKTRQLMPEELEMLELEQVGIQIPNLSSGLRPERKAQVLNMDAIEGEPATRLLNRFLSRPILRKLLNSSAELAFKIGRSF